MLNVSSVYLNDIKFNNLKVYFKDGFVIDYSCDNFEDGMKGKALLKKMYYITMTLSLSVNLP